MWKSFVYTYIISFNLIITGDAKVSHIFYYLSYYIEE